MSNANDIKKSSTDEKAVDSVGSALGSFANRIARKLKEQEQQNDISKKEAKERHARMLSAMSTARKALAEVQKISFGERFSLQISNSDWEGWPRVQVDLIDSLAPQRVDHGLVIIATDNNSQGKIQFSLKSGKILTYVSLVEPKELERLPILLKRTVRQFLELVTAYVLDPIKPEDLIETQTKPIDDPQEADVIGNKLMGEDLFSDDSSHKKSVLVDTAEVEPLATIQLLK